MGLFSRDAVVEVGYARCLDGRHLWVDAPAEAELALRGDGVDLAVGAGPVPLPESGPDLLLVAERRATPVRWAGPPPVDGPLRDPGPWRVDTADGSVRVVHTAAPARPTVLRISVADDGVSVEHSEGVLLLDRFDDLVPGTSRRLDVVRSRNLLVRPNAGVVLPSLPEPGLELRWLKDGTLAVHRKGAGVTT